MTAVQRTIPSTIVRRARIAEEQAERRHRRNRRIDVALGAAVPISLVVLWQLGAKTGQFDQRYYPAPTTIFSDTWALIDSGRLLRESWSTLKLIISGFVLGALGGFVIGAAMGCVTRLRAALEPMLNGLYVVPKLALLPIFLTILGFGDAPKIALVAVTVFFFVWIETMEAISRVPAGYLDAARSFELGWVQMFRHVYLPASLPQVFVGLRISMGVAVLITIASEFVIGGTGLGFLIFNSRQLFQISFTYVGIVWVALLGVALSGVVSLCGSLLTPWTRQR